MNEKLGVFLVTQGSLPHLAFHLKKLIACESPESPPVVVAADMNFFDVECMRVTSLNYLSHAEYRRSLRFSCVDDCYRFVLGRYLLRTLFSALTNRPASSVPVLIDSMGKPYSPGAPNFNISHSGSFLLLALHCFYPVGVDVEKLVSCPDWRAIGSVIWDDSVLRQIESFPVSSQSRQFLRRWCQHEACLKSIGTGFFASDSLELIRHCRSWNLDISDDYLGCVALS